MASTWVWRGDSEALELVGGKRAPTEVGEGDAVILASDRSLDTSRFRGVWLLNEGMPRALGMTEAEKRRVWRRAGLYAGKPLESERLFRISIVHLEPVEMLRLDRSGKMAGGSSLLPSLGSLEHNAVAGTPGGGWPADAALRRVLRAAVQALYALGLDVGEVEAALGGDGRVEVRDAWPMLRDAGLESSALRRFAAWHATIKADPSAADGKRILRIGADPEFVLVKPSGKIASASRFFGAGIGGAAGADAMLVRRRLVYPVAELRPEPAADPAALAANVRRLLLRAAKRIGDPALRWAAGAMPVPGLALGGHIHLSGAPLTARLLRLLDSCAAYPLALVEDPAGRGRRPRYGRLGDYRLQPHGGFEYRTLPSWLVSPAAAKAAFALALLCAREAWTFPRIPAQEERFAEAYYAGDRTELAGCLDDVCDTIASVSDYALFAPYIEPLFSAARRGAVWNEQADIRVKWRIPMQER